MDKIEMLRILKWFSKKGTISKQEFRTLQGQVLSGNIEGANKGLERIIKRKQIKDEKLQLSPI